MMMAPGEVHLWRGELDRVPEREHEILRNLLDAGERERAGRFYFERDRRRFTIARGLLRVLLGRYLRLEPAGLVFGHTGRGKPFLTVPDTTLRFNISHSDGHALFAFADGREVGVDIEAGTRLGDDWPMIARRYFSEREQAELASLPPAVRRNAFLHGWARKEAYLKATGLGIADGLQNIEVSMAPDRPPIFLSEDCASGWAFVGLGKGVPAAALVLERRPEDATAPSLREMECSSLIIRKE